MKSFPGASTRQTYQTNHQMHRLKRLSAIAHPNCPLIFTLTLNKPEVDLGLAQTGLPHSSPQFPPHLV
ncbi:MAG: hypothetical protein QNJ46_02560 [Leptolyngbyaceae cyanobacterium MO_188.B28]|nr:hypothetical protein [Leptolyngbyaceae cyanobacterium MO_188.B28]